MKHNPAFPSSQIDEMATAFRAMPLPELLAFLNTMLLHRMLAHRQVQALVTVAYTNASGAPQAHLTVSDSTESTDEAAVLRQSLAALQYRLDQISPPKGRAGS